MFGKRRTMPQPQAESAGPKLPPWATNGTLAQISVLRRQGKKSGPNGPRPGIYHPSGWDLVDTYTNQVIAEYNDETAPATSYRAKVRGNSRTGLIRETQFKVGSQNGTELGELFQAIHTLCYNTTIEALQLIGEAMPQHQDSADGQPIAVVTMQAYTTPGTVNKHYKQEDEPF